MFTEVNTVGLFSEVMLSYAIWDYVSEVFNKVK